MSEERIIRLEEQTKTLYKKVDQIGSDVKEIKECVTSMRIDAARYEAVKGDVESLKKSVGCIERWMNRMKGIQSAISAIVSAAVAYLVSVFR